LNNPVFRAFPALFGLVLAVLPAAVFAQDWYISNAAGMTLERAFSRLALRNKYALSVEPIPYEEVPQRLEAFYDPLYQPELRVLYENGEESRRQWIFRDEGGVPRLVAAFGGDGSGFIEVYNADELITGEHQIAADGSDYITQYIYNDTRLIRAETRLFTPPPVSQEGDEAAPEDEAGDETAGAEPVLEDEAAPGDGAIFPRISPDGSGEGILEDMWTDYYRYSRSSSLRAVERRYHRAPPEDPQLTRLQFPHMGLREANMDFVGPGSSYSSGFFSEVLANSGDRILYTTDERGRILTETRRDENDVVLGELRNNWAGDRLASISWKAGEHERLTEYEYNEDGDRILERNYADGVLERAVRREGEQEVEELYMNGAVILRAVWEEGRKISEERVRSQPGRGE
jgi:hypothetical protein